MVMNKLSAHLCKQNIVKHMLLYIMAQMLYSWVVLMSSILASVLGSASVLFVDNYGPCLYVFLHYRMASFEITVLPVMFLW